MVSRSSGDISLSSPQIRGEQARRVLAFLSEMPCHRIMTKADRRQFLTIGAAATATTMLPGSLQAEHHKEAASSADGTVRPPASRSYPTRRGTGGIRTSYIHIYVRLPNIYIYIRICVRLFHIYIYTQICVRLSHT